MWEGVDNSMVWLVRSPGTVSHWTSVRHLYIIHVQKHAQDIFFLVPTSLTNCSQSRSSEHCSDSSHVTAPYKLLYFINQEKPPVGQKLQNITKICLVVINKTIVQQNRIKSLHRATEICLNKNEDARTSPVVSANR